MKKAFGQTVRDLKRGVNKKVLKVPGIEQKVLDATSNESWGPHGSLLADIAHASRNYHEYQLTMGVLWKRLSDTGKNWRHVFKALTVLEYMVGHGSERVIDEIKEHAYQISSLSEFQYIDSSGKDQGNNVRKKSQILVALINDKEKIAEVREKAAANRDKYGNSTVGGMNRPSEGYEDKYDYDGRYGDKNEGRSSYGREREYGRDDDRNSRDGDRYSRDSEDRYGRDGNKDDEYGGRSRSVDNYQNGSRSRSLDRESQSSSRDSGPRAGDHSQDGRGGLQRKYSEQNIGASPPSYEEAVSESRSPVLYSERDGGETPQVAPPGVAASSENISLVDNNKAAGFVNESSPQQVEAFDEFDPRGSVSENVPTAPSPCPSTAVSTSIPLASSNTEMDLLGSLSDVFSPNPLAIVTSDSTSVETNEQPNTGPAPSFSTSQQSTQPFDDPFGDSPFKAITSEFDSSLHQSFGAPFQPTPPTSNHNNGQNFDFEESFTDVPNPEPEENFITSDSEIDILAGILPPSGPQVSLSQPNPTLPTAQFPPNSNISESYNPQADLNMPGQTPFGQASQQYNMVSHSQNLPRGMQFNNGGFMQQTSYAGSPNSQPLMQQTSYAGSANSQPPPQYSPGPFSHPTTESFPHQPGSAASSSSQTPYPTAPITSPGQFDGGNFMTQQAHGVSSNIPQRTQSGPVSGNNNNVIGDMFAPAGLSSLGTSVSQQSLTSLTGAIEIIPQTQKKFEPKSTIWADTLSRGLVNFNISGPKTNPLADIGVDFAAINRKEKRLEKPTAQQQQVTSTINMGKAMGSGTGLGRAGAGPMRPPPSSMVGSNMGMNVGGYGGMNQNQPMGMNQNQPMGMNQNQNQLMGMNQNQNQHMGMNQNQLMGINQNQLMGMNQNHPMGMNQNHPMGSGMNQNHPMGSGMNQNHPMGSGMNQNYPTGMNQNHPMGSGMNQNHPMGSGMNQNYPTGMNQNHPMGSGLNQNHPMGMVGYGQGYPMQPQQGMPMAPGPPQGITGAYSQGGYNPQQHQPYGGGFQ